VNSDRRGLRLDADDETAPAVLAMPGDRPSFGVVPGAIQLTPSGQPIVLMPDGGVTGGYAVIAVVASADQPRLGQLVPGAPLRFTRTDRHPSVMVRT
jgi:allophanate hydrolase subunit 2